VQAHPASPSFFDGLTEEELARVLGRLEHRRFAAGTILLAAGETLQEMYIVHEGVVDVLMIDRHGVEHRLSQIGPGGTVGEMSLFAQQPASATVRANTDTDVLVLTDAEFERAASQLPRIYRNLGAILSRRLTRTNSRWLGGWSGRAVVLVDSGAPPLLGYALACSVAWHTRKPTVFVAVTRAPPEQLVDLTRDSPPPRTGAVALEAGSQPIRAHALLTQSTGSFSAAVIHDTIEDLSARYDHVLVQVPADFDLPAATGRRVHLLGAHDPQPAHPGAAPGHTIRGWVTSRRPNHPERDGSLRVPELTYSDFTALRGGLLPPTTGAARALGWAARDLARLKVGLVFGGGSEKGYAHIGVWRVLEKLGMPVDYLAGTSIGSAVAALHALGYSPDTGTEILDMCGANAFRLALSTASVLSSTGLRGSLQSVGQNRRIEDLQTPLAVLAADVNTGREIVFRHGLLWPAVLASMALPGVYPPQCIGPYTLVDGGVLNPVPSNVAAEMGANTVIAVRLTAASSLPPDYPEASEGVGKPPTILRTIGRAIEMMQSKISADTAAAATILIEVNFENVERVGLRRWAEARRYIELGEAAAQAAEPRITAALPWL
jgi:NTE family protein